MNRIRNAEIKLPDLILMDLDNTVYSYQESHLAAYDFLKRSISTELNIPEERFALIYDEARSLIKKQLGNTASSHSRFLYLQRFYEMLGMGSCMLQCLEFERLYWKKYLMNMKLYPEVVNFLDDVRQRKITLCIVTDLTSEIQFRKLIKLGISGFVDYVVTSEEAGSDKPNKIIFELAIKKTGINPNNIWMIGDDYDKDIMGAKEVNATGFLKTEKSIQNNHEFPVADWIFKDFSEVRKVLQNAK
ncbi:HAD family hydrolase [Planktomarina temperata]|nr:HAD family hydrolase [Planktomarina temperata]